MGRKKTIHKKWLKVKKTVKKINKQLYEDVFKERFKLVLTGNKQDYYQASYGIYVPELLDADNAGDPAWKYSVYEVRLEDTEEPERSFTFWCEYSDTFGLIHCRAIDEDNYSKMVRYKTGSSGLNEVWVLINNFIVNSDFWKKWDSLEYKKTHWYSGEELERVIACNGSAYKSPEGAEEAKKAK